MSARTAVELCATCGGWISIGPTLNPTPYEDDGVTIAIRLPGDRDVEHYTAGGGCRCTPLPAGEVARRMRADESEWLRITFGDGFKP